MFESPACDMCGKGKSTKSSSLLTEDRREALLLGHRSVCSSVVLERLHVGLDHLAAAVRALSGMSAVCRCTWWEGGWGCPLLQTHNDHLLGRLDGETIGLDRGTGAGGFGLLVLALDLGGSALGDQGGSTAAAAVEVARLIQEGKRTFIFLETAIVRLGCQTSSKQVGLDWIGGLVVAVGV